MLNRRQLRLKSMEAIYAFEKSIDKKIDTKIEFFLNSSKNFYSLYIFVLSFFVHFHNHCILSEKKIKKNFLKKEIDLLFTKFSKNSFLALISNNDFLKSKIKSLDITYWNDHPEHLKLIINKIFNSNIYKSYIDIKNSSFEDHKRVVVSIFKRIVASDDKLYEYVEEKSISWINDFPLVNTLVLESLKKIENSSKKSFVFKKLYKKKEDENFGTNLIKNVISNEEFLKNEIIKITSNWDEDRIADIDMVLLKMCLTEFLYFKSIPVKVSINEYLEIAKEFSGSKSNVFINGILDKLSKQLISEGKLNKNRRGLQ